MIYCTRIAASISVRQQSSVLSKLASQAMLLDISCLIYLLLLPVCMYTVLHVYCYCYLTVVAAKITSAWYIDPIGAIVISLWIVSRWASMTWDQSAKLIGRSGITCFEPILIYLYDFNLTLSGTVRFTDYH
jgi:energy-coupling factor transporter transmembrane protein EcfT